MSLTVRPAAVADVAAMHRLRNRVRENRLSDPRRVTGESYLPYITAGSAWVAEAETGLVGFAAVDGQSRQLWALFVDPGAEGAGVGRALHRRLLQWAKEQGIGRLSLTTGDNTRAADFYRRAGWKQTGLTADGDLHFEMMIPA